MECSGNKTQDSDFSDFPQNVLMIIQTVGYVVGWLVGLLFNQFVPTAGEGNRLRMANEIQLCILP